MITNDAVSTEKHLRANVFFLQGCAGSGTIIRYWGIHQPGCLKIIISRGPAKLNRTHPVQINLGYLVILYNLAYSF